MSEDNRAMDSGESIYILSESSSPEGQNILAVCVAYEDALTLAERWFAAELAKLQERDRHWPAREPRVEITALNWQALGNDKYAALTPDGYEHLGIAGVPVGVPLWWIPEAPDA